MIGVIEIISRFFARLTSVLVVLQAAALFLSILISVFFRYVVGMALSWPEEISLILFSWLVLLATSLGVREGFHVRLSVLFLRFPKGVQAILQILITLAIGGFGAVLLYSGLDLVERTAQHLTPTLRLPLDWLNYSAPVAGALIVLHAIKCLVLPPDDEG